MMKNGIKYHKKNQFQRFIANVSDVVETELAKEFNCIHGLITGIIMALMFIGALFV